MQLKRSNKALLFIGCCHKSTETISFAGRVVMHSSQKQEVRGINLGLVKSNTVLKMARHRCDIFSKGAVLPRRNYMEMGPANSLHVSV